MIYDIDSAPIGDHPTLEGSFVQGIDPLIRLLTKYNPIELNELAYNATFPVEANNSQYYKDLFAFCYDEILNSTCRMVVFDLIAGNDEKYINDGFFYLSEGSCTDTFSSPFFKTKLAQHPPVDFVENYSLFKMKVSNF